MIINVKGTKSTGTSADPAARYAQKEPEQLSVVPKALTLAFVGVALYLKSFFPALAGGGPKGHGTSGQDDPAGAWDVALMGAGASSDTDTNPAEPGSGHSRDTIDAAPGLSIPAVSAVIRLTDVSHRMEKFTLDSIAVTAWPNLDGRFKSTIGANSAGAPAVMGRIEKSAPLATKPANEQTPNAGNGSSNTDKHEGPPATDTKDRSGPNRAPRVDGPVYLRDVVGTSVLLIGLVDLLRHTVDPDGEPLSVLNVSVSSGEISVSGADWVYQANGEYSRPVVISYTITDGEFEVSQTAHFTAVRPWVQGTDQNDLLIGTNWSDDISGGAGDDNIDGRDGNDVISGGDGADHILGGAGCDTIFGGSGNDILLGQDGDDHLFGGAGEDRLFGGADNDVLFGGEGADSLYGGEGDDLLDGGEGDDVLLDGAGADAVFGGTGDDVVIADADAEDDWFSGGDGFDTIDYSLTTNGVVIDLSQGFATGVEIGTDTLEGFEHAIGGAGDDHLIGGAAPSILSGGAGDNTFEFIAAPATASPVQVTHEITDFKHGDKLKMSHYQLFDKVFDELEDEFEAMYGKDIDEDDIPIQVRHDTVENVRRTIIEADFDFDNTFETTVFIQGHHVFVVTDMTA